MSADRFTRFRDAAAALRGDDVGLLYYDHAAGWTAIWERHDEPFIVDDADDSVRYCSRCGCEPESVTFCSVDVDWQITTLLRNLAVAIALAAAAQQARQG